MSDTPSAFDGRANTTAARANTTAARATNQTSKRCLSASSLASLEKRERRALVQHDEQAERECDAARFFEFRLCGILDREVDDEAEDADD